jgi:DNA-binding NtrC family response regulator
MTNAGPVRVLVIDDEAAIRESLATYLEDFDFSVITAEGAEQGLQVVKDKRPDVAIVGLRLPGMGGDLFVAEAHAFSPSTHFLLHTGSTDYQVPPELERIGVQQRYVFLKPQLNLDRWIAGIRGVMTERTNAS